MIASRLRIQRAALRNGKNSQRKHRNPFCEWLSHVAVLWLDCAVPKRNQIDSWRIIALLVSRSRVDPNPYL